MPSVWRCCPPRRFAAPVQKDEEDMKQTQTTMPVTPLPFAGLALLLAEMQALAQVLPSFVAARPADKASVEAQFDNMPV